MTDITDQAKWRIVQGDALDVLRDLDGESVDAIITDPPYASGGKTETAKRRSRGMTSSGTWFTGDAMGTQGLVWLLRSIAFEAERILIPGGSLLVFCDWRMWGAITPAMESAGLILQQMIVWDKIAAGMGEGFRPTHELIAELRKQGGGARMGGASNILRHGRVPGAAKVHPTEKPISLMSELILTTTKPGGLVVDPFCGSGPTGVAAKLEGRRFLGIERDPRHVETAQRRIDSTREQVRMDIQQPKQEALL